MKPIPRETIIRASRGDIDAFEEIYRASSSYVFTIGYRVAGNKEDAEEIAQDVFLSVYKNLAKFNFKSAFKTWIYRITMNTAINLYRKRSKKQWKETQLDENIAYKTPEEGGSDRFDREHNEAVVNSMLQNLSPDQRACIVLKEIEGLKYEEIAETLKININTVRSRLKRARKKLISLYRNREKSHEM